MFSMKPSTLPANKLVKASSARPTGEVIVSPLWKPLLEEICLLKEALDHATRWQGKGENEVWVQSALQRNGLDLSQFSEASHWHGPKFPDKFIHLLLGKHMVRARPSEAEDLGPVEMPSWAVVGWVRKGDYKETPTLSTAELESLANQANEHPEVLPTEGFEGVPFFLAGEGKNRTQLQRLAGVPRVCHLVMHPRPAFEAFRARPVALLPWAVALEHPDYPTEVLPFGELSKKLLQALGVPWTDKASWKALLALRHSCGKGLKHAPSWPALLRSYGDHANLQLGIVCGGSLMRSSPARKA